MSETKIGKFVIINLDTLDPFKSHRDQKILFYSSQEEAIKTAWFYELENVHILEIKNYYDEEENDRAHAEWVKEQLKK